MPVSPATATPPSPTTPPRRRTSISESFMNARPPLGALAATGEVLGRGPSLVELRRDSASSGVPTVRTRSASGSASRTRGGSSLSGAAPPGGLLVASPPIAERKSEDNRERDPMDEPIGANGVESNGAGEQNGFGADGPLNETASTTSHTSDGPKLGWWAATKAGLLAFCKWFITPFGFFLTIYMLNVVAWGGMLFLLLCNASPAMCKPTCNDINSPRRIWIEIDSQILNSLFCVTGFGLIPWRFRDLYHLLNWRVFSNNQGYIKLQEIHSNWYRAPNPLPTEEEHPPLTGERAPTTKSWKLDYVIWLYVWNTFFQVCLSGFMWGMNRYNRPSWSTGLFVALACGVAGMAGGQVWWESRKVKRIEGERPKEDEGEGAASAEQAESRKH